MGQLRDGDRIVPRDGTQAVRLAASRFGTGALVVAALALGQVLNEHLPDGKEASRPFERHVEIGETARLRTGDLTPLSVDGAKAVLRDSSASIRAQGVGVVLHFDFVSRQEANSMSYALFRGGDGTKARFSSSGQRNRLACPAAPPGIVVHCTAVFEINPDSLVGSSLMIAPNSLDERFDEAATIDLAVSKADVKRWKATQQIEVVESEVDGL